MIVLLYNIDIGVDIVKNNKDKNEILDNRWFQHNKDSCENNQKHTIASNEFHTIDSIYGAGKTLNFPLLEVDDTHVLVISRIKDRIEEHQRKTGISKSFMAEKLGMSKQSLSDVFKSNNPRLDTLVKFSILLDCNINELFDVYRVTHDIKNYKNTE